MPRSSTTPSTRWRVRRHSRQRTRSILVVTRAKACPSISCRTRAAPPSLSRTSSKHSVLHHSSWQSSPLRRRCATPESTRCLRAGLDTRRRYMGYSVRTPTWRYTEFAQWDGHKLCPIWNASVPCVYSELYDHATGESFMRVHWVAVPKAMRARRANRRRIWGACVRRLRERQPRLSAQPWSHREGAKCTAPQLLCIQTLPVSLYGANKYKRMSGSLAGTYDLLWEQSLQGLCFITLQLCTILLLQLDRQATVVKPSLKRSSIVLTCRRLVQDRL
jgi:hypothetical protein